MFNATGKNAGSAPNSIGGSHRLKNVLLIAAGKAGYGVKPMPENTAMGIASVASQERGSFGEGIVKRFAKEGAHVLVADINIEGAEKVASEINTIPDRHLHRATLGESRQVLLLNLQ